LDLYKTGIESKVLLENSELSPFTYKNVVAIGLRLNEITYIADFIERYHAALPIEHRKNFYDYCRARLYFTQGNYAKAMPLLMQMNYGDIYLQLDANVMLCKMYFELKEMEVLTSFLHTFKQFVRRRKDEIGYHYENYYNIIRFISRMLYVEYSNTKNHQRLFDEIEACSPLTEKTWLLEQIKKAKI
jgi:tetratricopeptide (TPR) repeat protein